MQRPYVPLNGPELIEAIIADIRARLKDHLMNHLVFHAPSWIVQIDISHAKPPSKEPQHVRQTITSKDLTPMKDAESISVSIDSSPVQAPDALRKAIGLPLRGDDLPKK